MTKKTRLTILLLCVVVFFIAAPYIILYSLGYRADFEDMKVVATGGIYVRTFPSADQVIIDAKNTYKPGMFNGAVFVQSLLPKDHSVLIEKEGYYNYNKTLAVLEKEVTKLENVFLFKKDIKFEKVEDATLSPFITKTKEKVTNSKTSPDENNIISFDGKEVFVQDAKNQENKKTLLYKASGDIIDCLWLNNDYVLFNITTDKIIISEIDFRGNINSVVLDQSADKISFNSQEKKLYILTQKVLMLSEKLVP